MAIVQDPIPGVFIIPDNEDLTKVFRLDTRFTVLIFIY